MDILKIIIAAIMFFVTISIPLILIFASNKREKEIEKEFEEEQKAIKTSHKTV